MPVCCDASKKKTLPGNSVLSAQDIDIPRSWGLAYRQRVRGETLSPCVSFEA